MKRLAVSRTRRLGLVALTVTSVVLSACGGGADAGTGSGPAGGVDWDGVLGKIHDTFGTTMISGKMDGDTVDITLADGSGSGMAKLFLCSNIRKILEDAGAPADQKVTIRDSKGVLSTQADCAS